MTKTHWRTVIETNYLGAHHLDKGDGTYEELTLTIRKVVTQKVYDSKINKEKDCLVVEFSERGIKPLILNVTNSNTLVDLCESSYIEDWVGKRIRVGVDRVRGFGGKMVDAIRIRNFLPKPKNADIICSDCGGVVKGRGKATAQIVADNAVKEFGQPVCLDCWEKRKEITKPDATDLSDAEERHMPGLGGMLGELPDPREA